MQTSKQEIEPLSVYVESTLNKIKNIILNTKSFFNYTKKKLELNNNNVKNNLDLEKCKELKEIYINNLEVRIKKITSKSIESLFKIKYSIYEKLKIVEKCFLLLKAFVDNNQFFDKIFSDILELHKIDQNKTQCHQLISGIKELQGVFISKKSYSNSSIFAQNYGIRKEFITMFR